MGRPCQASAPLLEFVLRLFSLTNTAIQGILGEERMKRNPENLTLDPKFMQKQLMFVIMKAD